MIVLPIVFLTFLVMGAFMYLLVCVDPNSPGPLGAISRFVFGKVPDIVKKLFGTRIYNVFANALDYFFYSNHPLVQIFYLFVAVGGYMMYAYHGFYMLFQDNPLVSNFDSLIGSTLALYSFYSFYQACHYKAGIITKENQDQYVTQYKDYYDNIIYLKDNSCKTCDLVKPARSKHCRTCNVCVSRFDHHCVWIKQCVGQKNYKYFIKFIGLHALLCDYGTVIGFRCLYGLIMKENLFNARFKDPYTGQPLPTGWMIICRYLFYRETIFVFIVVLCVVMGVSLTGFFAYHLSMIRKDTTTNEKMKVSDYKQYFKDDIKRFDLIMKDAKNEEEIKEAESKSAKAKMYLKRLEENEKVIGVYAGLKSIFSEPDEVKPVKLKKKKNNICQQHQEPLHFVNAQGSCCVKCNSPIPLSRFIAEYRQLVSDSGIKRLHSDVVAQIENILDAFKSVNESLTKMLFIDQSPALDLMQGRINMTTLQQMLSQVNITNEAVTLRYQWQNLYSALLQELQDNQLISQINSLNRRLDQIRVQYEQKSSDSSKLREIVSKLQAQQRVITPERSKDEFKNQNAETRSISPGINFGLTKQAPSVVTPTRNSNQQSQLPDSLQSQRQKNYMKVSTPQQLSTIKTDQYQMQSGEMLVSTRSKSPNASPLPQWTIPKKDAIKGTQIFSIKAHEKRVSAIAVAPECVFTASYDKQIRSWDKLSGAPRFIHEGHRKEVLCLKFKHEVLISGGLDKEIRIWKHSPRYQMANILKGHEQAVTCLDFINQSQIVSGSTDHTFRVWDINKATLLYVQQFPGPIHSLLLEKELLYLASGPVIFNFKISNFQKIDEKVLHESNIISIVLTQQYLITICEEGIIKVSDRQQLSREIKSFKDDYEISCAIYIQKLDILAIGLCNKNGDGKLCLWNIDTQKKLLDLSQNGSGVGALQFDDYLYSGHENKCLQAIKLE